MSRYDAGSWPHDADGVTIMLDREHVDPGVVRLLVAAISAAGLTPSDVYAVEFPDEATPDLTVTVEYHPPGYVYRIVRRRLTLPIADVVAEARRTA